MPHCRTLTTARPPRIVPLSHPGSAPLHFWRSRRILLFFLHTLLGALAGTGTSLAPQKITRFPPPLSQPYFMRAPKGPHLSVSEPGIVPFFLHTLPGAIGRNILGSTEIASFFGRALGIPAGMPLYGNVVFPISSPALGCK